MANFADIRNLMRRSFGLVAVNTVAPLSGGGNLSVSRTITTSVATSKLIGRYSGGTGVMQEIALGTNLSFAGDTLNAAGGTGVTDSFETVAKNLSADDATFNYTGDQLDSIDYAAGITKTFNYTGDTLDSIILSGATPGGIALTKTLTYTGDALTDIAYA